MSGADNANKSRAISPTVLTSVISVVKFHSIQDFKVLQNLIASYRHNSILQGFLVKLRGILKLKIIMLENACCAGTS